MSIERAEGYLRDRLDYLVDSAERVRPDTNVGRAHRAKLTPEICDIVRTLKGRPDHA